MSLKDRLRSKSKLNPSTECLEWVGTILRSGYGQIRLHHGKAGQQLAHRVSYAEFKGPIPNTLHVLHKCDNRKCINPNHLFLGTHTDNMRDMENKNRSNHVTGEKHGRVKLKEIDVLSILSEYKKGNITQRELANRYNVSQSAISLIVIGTNWSHLKE